MQEDTAKLGAISCARIMRTRSSSRATTTSLESSSSPTSSISSPATQRTAMANVPIQHHRLIFEDANLVMVSASSPVPQQLGSSPRSNGSLQLQTPSSLCKPAVTVTANNTLSQEQRFASSSTTSNGLNFHQKIIVSDNTHSSPQSSSASFQGTF